MRAYARGDGMKVYLSGPISLNGTATPEQVVDYLQVFEAMADYLRAQGVEVLSPAEIKLDQGSSWSDYMRVCIPMLCQADRIDLLPDWWKSRGSVFELEVAHVLGLEVQVWQ